MSFEAYKIAVHLGFTSNGVGLLGALAGRLFDVESKVKSLTGSFNRMHLAMYGGLALIGGAAMIKGIEKIIDKTKDLSNELVKLERLGGAIGTAAASGELTKRAFDIAQRVPMNVVDLLKIPGFSYSIVGQQSAMEIWPELAKFSTVLQSQKNFKGDAGDEIQKLLRASEISGRLTDPKTREAALPEMRHFLDLAARIVAATHGMVNPSTLLGMAQQGGFTLRSLSDNGFYTQAIMAQAMGGHRSGTALLSLWQQMAGGVMFKRSAEGLQAIGMLGKNEWDTDHGRVILGEEASKRLTSMIGKDPLDFAANLIAKMKDRGITDPEQQMRKITRALGRQTTQRYTAEEVMNFHQMVSERERMRKAYGAGESFDTIMNKDVEANVQHMHKAWDNLLYAIAGPNSENTIKILQTITGALQSLTTSINQMNPDTLRNISIGFGVLASTLVGAGAVALLAAIGPAGWLVLGIGALSAAVLSAKGQINAGIDAIIAAIKGSINAGLNAIIAAIQPFVSAIGGAAGPIGAGLGAIIAAIASFIEKIKQVAAGIASVVSGIAAGIAHGFNAGKDAPHPKDGIGGDGLPLIPLPRGPAGKQGYYSPKGTKLGMNGDIHVHSHIDGKEVAHSVSSYQVAMATHPNAIGSQDSHGSYMHPGTYAYG